MLNTSPACYHEYMNNSTSIYIHIPFCVHRCHYCDFNIATGQEHLIQAYTDAMVREIELAQPDPPAGSTRTVFFGGGTPSLLPPENIGRILAALNRRWPFEQAAEISLEANPDRLTPAKLSALRQTGINRLSLGVQSFDDRLLKRIGRDHDAATAEAAIRDARAAGFDNLSLDLIYALPGQSVQNWRETLERALAVQPNHISIYGLTIEDRTAFGRLYAAGKLQLPTDDDAVEMYLLAEELLDQAGFRHYEISNWAQPGYECRHNLTYWYDEPYLAFGCGAHAYWGGYRYHNANPIREYIALVEQGDLSALRRDVERIESGMALAEATMLALRLDSGLQPEKFSAIFGLDIEQLFATELSELSSLGLLEQKRAAGSHAWILTQRGRLLANQVCGRFVEAAERLIVPAA